jgi:hypothetical protein
MIALGVILQVLLRFFPNLGQLPGDIVIDLGNIQVYVPIVTMIILSVVLTIVLNVVARFFNGPR